MPTVGTLNIQVKGTADGPGGINGVLANVRSKLGSFAQTLGRGLAGGAAIGTGLFVAFERIADHIDDIAKQSARLGLTTEQFTRLGYAGKQTGVSVETMASGIGTLNRSLIKAAQGSDKQKDALKALGLSAHGLLALPMEERMSALAGGFANLTSGADKSAAAVALFGGSGDEMIGVLQGGSEAFNKLLVDAETFGAVISQDTAVRMERFQDALDNVKSALFSVAVEVADKLSPYLIVLAEDFANLAATSNNSAQGIGAAFQPVVTFFTGVGRIVSGVVGVVNALQAAFLGFLGLVAKAASMMPLLSAQTKELFATLADEDFRRAAERWEKATSRLSAAVFEGEFKFQDIMPKGMSDYLSNLHGRAEQVRIETSKAAQEIRRQRREQQVNPPELGFDKTKIKDSPAIAAVERGTTEAVSQIAEIVSKDRAIDWAKKQFDEQKKAVEQLRQLNKGKVVLAAAPL
jgi:hypothetical protein